MLLQLAKKQDEVLKHVKMPAPTPQYAPLPAPLPVPPPARPQPEYPAHSVRPAHIPMYGTAEPASHMPRPTRPQAEYPAHPSDARMPTYSPIETVGTKHEASSAYFDMPFPEQRQGELADTSFRWDTEYFRYTDPPAPRRSWPQPHPMGLRPHAEYPPYTESSPRRPTYSPATPARANYEATSAYYDTRPPMAEWEGKPHLRVFLIRKILTRLPIQIFPLFVQQGRRLLP